MTTYKLSIYRGNLDTPLVAPKKVIHKPPMYITYGAYVYKRDGDGPDFDYYPLPDWYDLT